MFNTQIATIRSYLASKYFRSAYVLLSAVFRAVKTDILALKHESYAWQKLANIGYSNKWFLVQIMDIVSTFKTQKTDNTYRRRIRWWKREAHGAGSAAARAPLRRCRCGRRRAGAALGSTNACCRLDPRWKMLKSFLHWNGTQILLKYENIRYILAGSLLSTQNH